MDLLFTKGSGDLIVHFLSNQGVDETRDPMDVVRGRVLMMFSISFWSEMITLATFFSLRIPLLLCLSVVVL